MLESNKGAPKARMSRSMVLMASSIVLFWNATTIASEQRTDELDVVERSVADEQPSATSVITRAKDLIAEPNRSTSRFSSVEVTQIIADDLPPANTPVSTRARDLIAKPTPSALHFSNMEVTQVIVEDLPSAEEDLPPAEADRLGVEDLIIPVRFGTNFSTSSAGFDEIIGINAFVPLRQTAGEGVTFLEGDVEFIEGNTSFSLNLGHRAYDVDRNVVHGGYFGFDNRSTDDSTFHQLAAGYERFGENWEFRLNGYLPIGDRTNTIRDVNTDTGLQTSSGFEGNQLVLSAVREQQRIFHQENALGGLDFEFGTQLVDWNGGELMGYAGGYLLTGEDSSIGGQLRLLANLESNFNAGLALQHDGLFGTNVVFSISASWPNVRFDDNDEADFQEEFAIPIRLRDPITRRRNVAVNVVEDSEIVREETTEPLRNPEEEEDYRFIHVDLAGGSGTGSGSYENPFGAVEDAIALINSDADIYSDGNTIVYVDGENAPTATIPGFAIPDRVRVLSQGPEQIIAGMAFSNFPSLPTRLPFSTEQNFNVPADTPDTPNANGITVSLPDSDDGVFPTIAGGSNLDLVTLGNSTVLAGFQINGATQHGVAASEVDNVELRNNLITNSGGSGIFLDNVGGSAILFDNEINSSGDRGIYLQNSQSDRAIEAAIAGFDLANNRVGMEFSTIATVDAEFPEQIVTIGPSTSANTSIGTPGGTTLTNSILNSAEEGLIVQANGDDLFASSSQQVSISEITIDESGGEGVQLIADVGAHQQEFNLDSSTVTNSGGNGITIVNGAVPAGPTTHASAQEVVITNSAISNSGGNGIDVTLADAGAQELVVQNNQIINNAGDGIRSIAATASVQEWRTDDATGAAGISGNVISGNGGQAIVIEVTDVATLPILGIVNNDLSGNGVGPDIEFIAEAPGNGSVSACLIVNSNQAPMGIELTGPDPIFSGDSFTILIEDLPAQLADPNVSFFVDLGGFIIPGDSPFSEETGGCIQ